MAKDATGAGADLPLQDEDVRAAILSTAPQGSGTATGKAAGEADEEIPSGKDRGSVVPIAGGSIKPDAVVAGKAIGNQLEPAAFTSNGSIPLGMVGSPGGSVPVGALGLSPEEAFRRSEESINAASSASAVHSGFARVSRRTIETASAANLRAAAQDRGWDIGLEAGSRVTRARFIALQNEKLGEEKSDDTGSTSA